MAASPQRALIDEIRSGFGLDSNGQVVKARALSNLESSLNVISDQLNQDVSHFLHEFIQNADDLRYDTNVEPVLSFEIADGQLIISSNEQGFSSSDVDAICSVAKSTKINDRTTTGEKGIGFKSLFKAANKVTVASNGFHFQFDRARRCGIVVPEWEEIPVKFRRPYHTGKTVFLVEFSTPEKAKVVLQDLRDLEPQILLFLRRLRKIEIIDNSTHVLLKEYPNQPGLSTISLKTLIDGSVVTDSKGPKDWRCFRAVLPIEVGDPSRPGQNQTEIALAFPVRGSLPRGHAFNMLPITTTSFPFIIQADFVLSASREGLDQVHQPWNDGLLKVLSKAYVQAVILFNKDEDLRHQWPQYLPVKADVGQFAPIQTFIQNAVRSSRVLFDANQSLDLPSNLCHVAEMWRDCDGKPLFNLSKSSHVNLSTKYADHLLPALQWLGIHIPTPAGIFTGFKKYLSHDDGRQFRSQNLDWHSRLASALLQYKNRDLESLPIVPIEGGEWVSASSQAIILPQCSLGATLIEIPRGLPDVHMVRKEFADSSMVSLRSLYLKVGVKPGTSTETCRLINSAHSETAPPSTNPNFLIHHVLFLFKSWLEAGNSCAPWNEPLWIVDVIGQPRKSFTMYQDESTISQIALKHIKGTTSERKLMHPDYLKCIASEHHAQWSKWLSTALGVLKEIRICDQSGKGFTPEFLVCQSKLAPSTMLSTLSDAWHENFARQDPSPRVLTKLSSMKKAWTSGSGELELQELFLPRKRVLERAPSAVPQLIVKEPESQRWDFLGKLGVVVDEGLDLWLRSLLTLMNDGSITKSAIKNALLKIYQSIEKYKYPRSDMEKIKDFFDAQPAIYIPSKEQWVGVEHCVWRSKIPLRHKYVLSSEWAINLKSFFKGYLGIGDVKAEDLIYELRLWTEAVDPEHSYLRDLWLALSATFKESKELLNHDQDKGQLQNLHGVEVMPLVKHLNGVVTRRTVALNNSCCPWFFVDRYRHQEAFKAHVWLADFPPEQSLQLKTLRGYIVDEFHIPRPFLSTLVTEVPGYDGPSTECSELTTIVRGRSGYIGCLASQNDVCEPSCKLDNGLRLLKNCTVNSVQSISTTMTLKMTDPTVEITGDTREKDRAILKHSKERLDFFISKITPQSRQLPLAATEKLCDYLCVVSDKHKFLIQKVLSAYDGEDARDILVSHNININKEADEIQQTNETNVQSQIVSSQPLQNRRGTPAKSTQRKAGASGAAATRRARGLVEESSPTSDRVVRPAPLTVLTADYQKILLAGKLRFTRCSRATARVGHGHTRPHNGKTNSDGYQLAKSSIIFPSGPPRRGLDERYDRHEPITSESKTGLDGEFQVYNFLQDILGDSFGPENWTSELREYAGKDFTKWIPPDQTTFFADFTYEDKEAKLAAHLIESGVMKEEDVPGKACVFHIEVKSTRTRSGEEGRKEGFEMSEWQFGKMREMSMVKVQGCETLEEKNGLEKKDVFLVFRVWGVGSLNLEVEVLVDLWREIMLGNSGFRVREGVVIYP